MAAKDRHFAIRNIQQRKGLSRVCDPGVTDQAIMYCTLVRFAAVILDFLRIAEMLAKDD